jgi:hypothetical protein
MTKPLRIICLTRVCLLTVATLAQSTEPYHINDDVLGETADAYKLNHQEEKLDCVVNPAADRFADESTPGLRACTTLAVKQPMSYAQAKPDSRLVRFDDDHLYELVYAFNSASLSKDKYGLYYDQLRTFLTEKFGKPTATEDSDFADAKGAHLQNQTTTWKNEVSTIVLTKFSRDLSTTSLTFSLDSLEEDARHQIIMTRKHRSEI